MVFQRWTRRGIAAAVAAGVGLALLAPAGAAATGVSFGSGEQAYAVPAGVASLAVVATGAPGGAGDQGGAGGFGATVATTLRVTPGEVIYVDAGFPGANASGSTGGTVPSSPYTGGGANGGSIVSSIPGGGGGAGGGASSIRSCSLANPFSFCFLTPPLVIAGGGGGGGGESGGGAGGAAGSAGGAGTQGATGGGPGTAANKGGSGGMSGGTKGDLLVGGEGAAGSQGAATAGAGGGGGGGMFGGGGGGTPGPAAFGGGGGGGGGGSSSVGAAATQTTIGPDATGIPLVTITPIPMAPKCAGNALNTLPGGSTVTVVLPCTTPMGVPITYSIVAAPAHGALGQIKQSAGTVTYKPKAGFTGTDRFKFAAANPGGKSSPATVTITVPAGPHCTVPKLKGSSLSAAKQKLVAAGCALGKVTKRKTHKHHQVVVAQGAVPGTRLGLHAKVAVTLG